MKYSKIIFSLIICIGFIPLLSGCSTVVRFSSNNNSESLKKLWEDGPSENRFLPNRMVGKASYYADKFENRKTSSGEIYSADKLTAAHRELPFGTYLKVTNRKNLKQVIVKVNDRGPFVSGRILDLSRSAAEELDMLRDGIAEVEIEIIE